MKLGDLVKLVSGTTAVLVLIGMLWNVGKKVDARYAMAAENQKDHQSISKSLELTIKRLDRKILQDRRDTKQNQIWALEEKNVKKKSINEWDQGDREKYKQLQKEMSDLDDELKQTPF